MRIERVKRFPFDGRPRPSVPSEEFVSAPSEEPREISRAGECADILDARGNRGDRYEANPRNAHQLARGAVRGPIHAMPFRNQC